MTFRRPIPDFQLANPLYAGATVFCYAVDGNGQATTTLATLYANARGSQTTRNPVILDAEGKFQRPTFIDAPITMEIVSASVGSHGTGTVIPLGRWRGDWASGQTYTPNDFVRDAATKDVYVVNDLYVSGATLAADAMAGSLDKLLNFADIDAATQAAAIAALNDKITISTDAPSGGVDGDLWFRIA